MPFGMRGHLAHETPDIVVTTTKSISLRWGSKSETKCGGIGRQSKISMFWIPEPGVSDA